MCAHPVGHLFRKDGDWFNYEQLRHEWLKREVQSYSGDRLLGTAPDALATYFLDMFSLTLPVLDEEGIDASQREVSVNANLLGPSSGWRGSASSAPRMVPGVEYEFHVPFVGDPELFQVAPTRCSHDVPVAGVREGYLVYEVVGRDFRPDQLKSLVGHFVANVNQHLEWLGDSVDAWNAALPGRVQELVEQRRRKLLNDRHTVASLGFRLRERPGAARTYAPPEVRRKLVPVMPPASSAPWKPEPALDMAHYEHILTIISDCSITMERSPSVFENLGEEGLRYLLLVALNGGFDGEATGETFNYEGKTDILIRSQGRNIFIAECKFWGGEKVLTATLNQLLGYASWRDTKVAVIVFNRNRDFSAVLAQVQPTVMAHPNCRRFVWQPSETQFRFTFTHRDDVNRELTLTVLCFDVPQP